jgi:hypothetical protein
VSKWLSVARRRRFHQHFDFRFEFLSTNPTNSPAGSKGLAAHGEIFGGKAKPRRFPAKNVMPKNWREEVFRR